MQMGAEASQQGALLTFAALISINRKRPPHCLASLNQPRLYMLLSLLLPPLAATAHINCPGISLTVGHRRTAQWAS